MSKNIKNYLIILFCVLFVCYGFLVVSSSLPKFIKDKSSVKINFDSKKVDLTIESGKYILYFNNKIISNFAEKTSEAFKSIESNFINKAN